MSIQETAQNILNSYFAEQTEEEIIVQDERKLVCYGDGENPPCEELRKIATILVCGECGCPIEKLTRKISSSNKCSLGKWKR